MIKTFPSIKTGVIGSGSMGQNHARVYNEISNLVAISDVDEKQGRLVADRFGIKWYKNYEEMLEEVDAVSISVPTELHKAIAEKVIESGVHLIIEKPLAGNIEDAKAIVNAASKTDIVAAVGHIERHNPVVKFAKEAIVQKTWGDVITLSSKRVSLYPQRIKDVGVIFDLAIHDLDIIRYLTSSEISSVFAVAGNREYANKEDHASIILNFKNGIKGICEVSWLTPMKVRQLSLTCSEAYVILDFTSQTVEVLRSELKELDPSDLSKVEHTVHRNFPEIKPEEPLKIELLDFLSSVNSKAGRVYIPPLVSLEDGFSAVSIAEMALDSASLSK